MSNDIRYRWFNFLLYVKIEPWRSSLSEACWKLHFFYDFQNHWGINDVMSFLHCWNRPLGCPLDMEYWLPPSRLPLEGMFSSLVELFVVCLENDDDDLSRIFSSLRMGCLEDDDQFALLHYGLILSTKVPSISIGQLSLIKKFSWTWKPII